MELQRLKAQHFRNFSTFDLEPCSRFNLIYGANGSGKTSILEAIHFLGLGRSFRSHLINRIIQYEAPALTVFGSVIEQEHMASLHIGIEKDRVGKLRLKVGNEMIHSVAQLAKLLPIQLLNPDSYSLLNSGPRPRREFLDWGVFHVEPSFFQLWQRLQKALLQRNAALQQGLPLKQIQAWDVELVPSALALTELRKDYFNQLIPLVRTLLADLLELENISMEYLPGWNTEHELSEVLANAYLRDKALGYTQYGPQRADMSIKVNAIPAQDILSRGEQKLLVCALRLAQGMLLRTLTGKRCLYLIDDLAAELDSEHRKQIIQVLTKLEAQVFVTAVDANVIGNLILELPHRMFHVEHNQVAVVR